LDWKIHLKMKNGKTGEIWKEANIGEFVILMVIKNNFWQVIQIQCGY
jgi:hypothetical protein